MTYHCDRCGADFSEPARETHDERSEAWGTVLVQPVTYLACPRCGNEDYDEVAE